MTHAVAILALLLQVSTESKPDERKIRDLVAKLDADDLETRAKAEAELVDMGEAVVAILTKAREGAGTEARSRIDTILSEVTTATRWAKDLAEGEPDQAYQRLRQALQGRSLDKKHLPRILSLIVQNESTSDPLRQYVISEAVRLKVREIWPALLQMVLQDERQASQAINYLQQLRPPKEAVDDILRVFPKVRGYAATQLLELALPFKPDRARLDAAIRAFLDSDADENGRSNVLGYLQQGRLQVSLSTVLKCWKQPRSRPYVQEAVLRTPPDESVGEILAWIASPQIEEVHLAVDYVARQKVVQASAALVEAWQKHAVDAVVGIPTLGPRGAYSPYYADGSLRQKLAAAMRAVSIEDVARRWLGSESGPARTTVLSIAAELELRGLAPEIVACLDDREAAVRKEAARASGALKLAEAAARLEALLKDEQVPVRRAALQALARARGAAATALVLDQLATGHPDVQAAAIEALPSMDVDAALDALTREPLVAKPVVKQALASLIVHLGEPGAHRVLARVEGKVPADELTSIVRLLQASRGR
jgi:hypothetical protein